MEKFTEATLKRIENLINENEKKMDLIEKRIGYVPIEVQNESYEKVKEIIKRVDKDDIAKEFYLEYDCSFPFIHNNKVINSYRELAELLLT